MRIFQPTSTSYVAFGSTGAQAIGSDPPANDRFSAKATQASDIRCHLLTFLKFGR